MTNNEHQLDLFGGHYGTDFIHFSEPLEPLPVKGCACNQTLNRAISATASTTSCQLSLPFSTIRINQGLLLAPCGVKLQKRWFVDELSQVSLVNELLNAFKLSQTKSRFHRGKYLAALSMLLANLLNALNTSSGLIVGRRTHHKINKAENPLNITAVITNELSDFLASQGLITSVIGKSNEYQGNASWLTPSDELRVRLEYSKARIVLAKGAQAIDLRDKQKDSRPLPTSNKHRAEITRLSKPVNAYNKTWLEHRLTYKGLSLIPFVKRIFNNDSLLLGGRFYNDGGSYQGLPSKERSKLLIDGQPTVELDYKSLHFNILYSLVGIEPPTDPYIVDGYTRNAIKAACLVFLNSEDLAAFKRNITKSGNKKIQKEAQLYSDKLKVYNIERARGLKADPPRKPRSLNGFIDGIPEGTKGADLLASLESAHEPIKHFFGTKDIGLRLQYQDSEIMALAMSKLNRVPVLPVHDSLICKLSDYQAVLIAMKEAFFEITNASIEVTDNIPKNG